MQPQNSSANRRGFLAAAGTALTSSLFARRLKGANERLSIAFIGMGRMGRSNLGFAMRQENVEIAALCDVYQHNLDKAMAAAEKQPSGNKPKAVRDFREILSDRSIDAVCISTPDHWHAYMTVEACKNGKDVYVEKPLCVTVEEGVKMVEAARKYKRVVQAGTMQRSAVHFQKAAELVRSGQLGRVTMVKTWNYGNTKPEGIGNPPDTAPPANLDWDLWLGPAPKRPFNANRFGVSDNDKWFAHFRWFWDYAGGMMTDWGVHWLDIVQMAFNEAMPTTVMALGGKYRLKDNRETPDTLAVTYEYPGMLVTYENREGNRQSMFGKGGGILFCGDQATLYVDRSEYRLIPEPDSNVAPQEMKPPASGGGGNREHWANFLECIRTRQKPVSDIETCQRSTTTCLLGNIALLSKQRVEFDPVRWTVSPEAARKMTSREYRAPWKLTV
jgi:predicted dehydrogenase